MQFPNFDGRRHHLSPLFIYLSIVHLQHGKIGFGWMFGLVIPLGWSETRTSDTVVTASYEGIILIFLCESQKPIHDGNSTF
jgi:hypothetical protein